MKVTYHSSCHLVSSSLPSLKCDVSANFNAALTGGIFLYSAQYVACMPSLMLVFHSWTMPASIFYSTRKCSISASNVRTPTSKWLLSASNVHTPKRMVQESKKFFGCVPHHKYVSVTYKNCDSGMGGPVWAIRLLNQKRLLLVMVGGACAGNKT